MQGSDQFTAYLESLGLSEHTVRAYRGVARALDREARGVPGLAVATRWLQRKVEGGATTGGMCAWRNGAKHWLTFHGIDAPLPPTKGKRRPTRLRQALTVDELREFYSTVAGAEHAEVRAVLRLLPLTGLRIQEVCNLRADQTAMVGKERGFRVVGKGRKERFVPLSSAAEAVLKEYAPLRRPSAWLFPGLADATRPLSPDTVRCALRDLRPNDRWTPHVLRHTFATLALDNGAALTVVKDLLGHSAVATTAIYVHSTRGALQRGVEAVGAAVARD